MVHQMKKKKNVKSKRIHDVQLIHQTILQLLGTLPNYTKFFGNSNKNEKKYQVSGELPQSKKVNMDNSSLSNIAKLLYLNKYKPCQTHSSSNSSTTCSSSSRRSSSSSSVSESDSSSNSSSCSSSSVSASSSSDESSSSSTTSTNTKSSFTSDMTLSDSTSTELDKSVPKQLIDDTSKDNSLQKSTRDESAKDLEIVFKPLRLSGLDNPKQYKTEDSLSTLKGCHICVKYLTVNVSVEHIREIFSRYGTIRNINVPLDVFTKLPKGFSYIEYSTPEEALMAIKRMSGGQIDGREIICTPMPYSAFYASRMNYEV